MGVYAALIADFYVKATVNAGRFRSGRWWGVAQRAGV